MILLNFAHPITEEQQAQIEAMAQMTINRVIPIKTQLADGDIAPQMTSLVESIDLSSAEWQSLPILLVPPGLTPAASCLIADLHGRMGYFPSIVAIRPKPDSSMPLYDATEIINLQALRDRAREQR